MSQKQIAINYDDDATHEFIHGSHCDRLDISREDAKRQNLAPTTYSPDKYFVLHKAPEWTIRGRSEDNKISNNPGPDHY